MKRLLALLLPFALAQAAALGSSAAGAAEPPSNVVILPPGPNEPPDPVELAAAQRLAELMVPPGMLPAIMSAQIEAMAPHPDNPPLGSSRADWEARRREIARREVQDPNRLRRDRITANIRREEYGAAYARVEPAFRAGLARYYVQLLPLSDIEAAERFFSTPEGTRFRVAMFGFPNVPSTAGIAPELAAAEARSKRRIAAETATIPASPIRRGRRGQ
jgi:hypothetical protein